MSLSDDKNTGPSRNRKIMWALVIAVGLYLVISGLIGILSGQHVS